MTFINWSDSEEMLGLLSEYVADARSESQGDPARERFLTELLAELAELNEQSVSMSGDDAIVALRAIHGSRSGDFVDDPVLAHVEACIEELDRIQRQGVG